MVPVVDVGGGVVEKAEEIFNAIEQVGFVYLTNHAISQELLDSVFAVTDKFWALPAEVKCKYNRPTGEGKGNTGYVAPNVELLDPENKAELREAYNITPKEGIEHAFPDAELPQFRPVALKFFEMCWHLSKDVMKALEKAMHMKKDGFFDSTHHDVGTGNNYTTLRCLHYPPVPDQIEAGSARCGEHSDYGTITLLFQDNVGGLEVKGRSGEFVPATYCPGGVLINAGDLLEMWTNGRIKAVKHRVLIPDDNALRKSVRRSLAFFVHPDDDVLVEPLDGSTNEHYPPITAKQHLLNMFSKTY